MTTSDPNRTPAPAGPPAGEAGTGASGVSGADGGRPRRRWSTRASLWLCVGILLAAGVLGAYSIIAGDQSNVAGRAWLTLLLVAAYGGAVILDTSLANGPNRWYLTASLATNTLLLGVGLLKLWNGWLQPADTASPWVWTEQLFRFFGLVLLLRLALLLTQAFVLRFITRARSRRLVWLAVLTLVLLWVTVLLLALPAAFPEPDWPDWWWRVAGAGALLTVVAAVAQLVVGAFEARERKAAGAVGGFGAGPHGAWGGGPGPGQQWGQPQPQPQWGQPQPQWGQPQGVPPQTDPQQAVYPQVVQPQAAQPQGDWQSQPQPQSQPPQPQWDAARQAWTQAHWDHATQQWIQLQWDQATQQWLYAAPQQPYQQPQQPSQQPYQQPQQSQQGQQPWQPPLP